MFSRDVFEGACYQPATGSATAALEILILEFDTSSTYSVDQYMPGSLGDVLSTLR